MFQVEFSCRGLLLVISIENADGFGHQRQSKEERSPRHLGKAAKKASSWIWPRPVSQFGSQRRRDSDWSPLPAPPSRGCTKHKMVKHLIRDGYSTDEGWRLDWWGMETRLMRDGDSTDDGWRLDWWRMETRLMTSTFWYCISTIITYNWTYAFLGTVTILLSRLVWC